MLDLVTGSVLSRVWRALALAGAALFAVELGPVLGLVSLMLFELSTTAMVARATAEEEVPSPLRADPEERREAKKRRRALVRAAVWEAVRERVGVAFGLTFVVIYANTSGLEWVKGMMFMSVGAVLLTLAWINLGRSNRLMRLLMRTIQKNLAARGIDIDTDDEEGPVVVVDAEVHATVRRLGHAPVEGPATGGAAAEDGPPSPEEPPFLPAPTEHRADRRDAA